MSAQPEADSADNGEHADLVVIGGGVAGLVAARRAALAGAKVVLLEAADRLGGMLATAELAADDAPPLTIDIGAEAFAVRGGAVAALLDELGLSDEIVAPVARGSWGFTDGAAYALPATGLLGIPAHPDAPDVRAALGNAGAERALRDAELDASVGAQAASLADLVRARMGDAVLQRLVGPVARGVYSTDPSLLDHRRIVPGLADRIAEAGGLAPAVARLRSAAPPGAAVNGLRGGMGRLVQTLEREVRAICEVRTGAAVVRLIETDGADDGCAWRAELAGGGLVCARAALLTVDPAASGIVVPALDAVDAPSGSAEAIDVVEAVAPAITPAEVVALLVDAPALDAFPRGTGVLVGDPAGGVSAKALTHVTAKWPWITEVLPAGRHVLRLSYGPARDGSDADAPLTRGLTEPALLDLALRDAAALLGVSLTPHRVRAIARREWRIPHPAARLERPATLDAARARAAAHPGLGLAGTWIDGTGLASVLPAAARAADALTQS